MTVKEKMAYFKKYGVMFIDEGPKIITDYPTKHQMLVKLLKQL